MTERPELDRLIAWSKAHVEAMTPEEREEMFAAQAASWVRAEMAFGSDADERAYRERMRAEKEPGHD